MNSWTKNRPGFTLLELLVALSIVALLVSLVLVSVSNSRERGRVAGIIQFDANVYHALGDEIVGFWNFEEGYGGPTAKDVSGHGNDGTLVNGVSWSTINCPYSGSECLSFDGTNDYVRVADNESLDLGTSDFTVSFWLKIRSNADQTIIGQTQTADIASGGWAVQAIRSGAISKLRMIMWGEGQDGLRGKTVNPQFGFLELDRWYHFVISVDRSQDKGISAYVDGRPKPCDGDCGYNNNKLSDLGDIDEEDVPLAMASRNPGTPNTPNIGNPGNYLAGVLDEVRIYKKAIKSGN